MGWSSSPGGMADVIQAVFSVSSLSYHTTHCFFVIIWTKQMILYN